MMKRYTLVYSVYVEVEAKDEEEAKSKGACIMSETPTPLVWYYDDVLNYEEIGGDEE